MAIQMVSLELAREELQRDYPEEEIESMEFGERDLIALNDSDGTTHGEIVAAFTAAITRAKAA